MNTEFCPTFIPEGLPDHVLQASPLLASYMAMEDGQYFLPQASPLVPPYLGPFVTIEEGITMHSDNLPLHSDSTPLFADPIISPHLSLVPSVAQHAAQIPSLASWSTTDPSLLLSHPFPFDQGQHLLKLQALLKSQYGINLTLDQLLAFDALPALLQAEGDQSQLDLGVKLEEHLNHSEMKFAEALSHFDLQSLQINQSLTEGVPQLTNKLLCHNEQYGSQEASSPGSAASSSVVTDGENSDNPLSVECLTAFPSILSPLGAVNSQSWINPTLSWMPSYEERSLIQAFNALQPIETIEPPLQRRKLHGITMEQVLQAEQMQQQQQQMLQKRQVVQLEAGLNFSDKALDSLKLSTSLIERSSPNMIRPPRGVFSIPKRDVNNTNHEFMRPNIHPRKPAATSVEPQSIAARHRRKRIRDRTDNLGVIIPGAMKLDTAAMFDLAIKYVNFLQAQMLCLEKEVSLINQRSSAEDEAVGSFRRALIHRLLSSQDVQHFLSREGLCLVTEGLAQRLKFESGVPTAEPIGRAV